MASSFPKSFPHSFFSLFLTSHFAYCYYSKATGLVFWGAFLETDLRIFLQGMDFSRNVESYQKHVELISIQWQLHPGWKPKACPPPPLQKIQTLGKGGKDLPGKKVESQGNAEMTGSTTKGKHTEDINTNKSPPFLFISIFNFQNCQSESSGLPSTILTTTEDNCS